MVRGAKDTEFGVGGRCDIFQDIEETVVSEVFFDVMFFLIPLAVFWDLLPHDELQCESKKSPLAVF